MKQGCYALVISVLLFSCSGSSNQDLVGLWQLERINIDGYERPLSRTFLDFKMGGSFAVSQVDGDFLGTYAVKGKETRLKSITTSWFNTNWKFLVHDGRLDLRGMELGHRNTKLTFRSIPSVPPFDDFEARLIGTWDLYKLYQDENVKPQASTQISFSKNSQYVIQNDTSVIESGAVIIDTRHQKVAFEHHETAWRAWFYGDELRLSNDQMGLRYCLRR